MKNKIIVTGGCGYIGSHTVIELLESNFEVVIFDDLSNSTEKTIDRISQITGKTPTFVKVDLKNETETDKVFTAHKDALAVIHFAAHKAVAESVKEPLKYYQNNFYSLINSLNSQLKNNITNFIFSSSATVYGLPKTLPITEKNKTKRPFSPYGNTKKVAEEILEDLTNSDPNFTAISLRYFNPIGAHESGLIGELPTGIPNNLMPYVTQTAAGIREKLMIYGNDYPTKDGTPIRDYIHVVDLAKAHVLAVKRLINKEQEKSFEYFNLGTGIGYSVLDIVKTFEKVTNSKLNYEITSRREGDVPKLYAATKLAAKKLGWTPKRELNEMISSSWKWEQNVRKEQK
ncbi:UDP-glucose 4-epimerase GalE [Cellulophaga sp. 20_2_10]|uniref:UDP-glucose 4-epimerase GalE n=1 Tax=Cellulophaga sp. 20_2_10 TaxID=2942476 RepID=UPI00201B3443|nr:UDP-glucose 4-epimerase GalE [Cellulophaga sp. 20_2_10]MCL5245308.1 UDP-glucose 4-epimerase GalE [Cellulophaga sp. 20_2_10]